MADTSKESGGIRGFVRRNLLTVMTMTGVVIGIGAGIAMRERNGKWTERESIYVKFVGELFLRMLKCLILPLIVSSLVSAIGGLDLSLSKKIGTRAIAYYMITTVLAVILGIVLVSTIKPGKNGLPEDDGMEEQERRNITTEDTLMDLVRNMFPPNLVQATMYTYQTTLKYDPAKDNMKEWKMTENFAEATNILGLVVFATVLGITLGYLGERGKPLLNVFTALSEATMVITGWVIWLSPFGVCCLIAGQIIAVNDIQKVFENLGMYFLTVMTGLLIHGFLVLPLIYTFFTRTLPFRFCANMSQAMATGFGTSSSSATLPVTMACLEEKNKIDRRVSRFILPIGATINMDGTALYEAVAAIWISQMVGRELDVGNIIAISITSTAAAIGAAGIPQAGLVTMVMVLNTIGLDSSYVAYVVPVDWLLDRFRTIVNVMGDAYGAGIVNHISRNDLKGLGNKDEFEPIELVQTSVEGRAQSQSALSYTLSNENDTSSSNAPSHEDLHELKYRGNANVNANANSNATIYGTA